MTRYRVQPPQIQQRGPGPLGTLGNFALQKGISAGINAAVPGGGIAAEAAQAVLPTMIPRFNEGGAVGESNWQKLMRQWREFQDASKESQIPERLGRIKQGLGTRAGQQQVQRALLPYMNKGGPIGGGQTKAGLEEARRLGALTQAEFLKAMAHGGYMKGGGKVSMGPLAGMKYKTSDGTNSHEYERKYHNPLSGGTSKEG